MYIMIEFVKPKRQVDRVFLHCSASSRPEHGSVDVIKAWHLQRGWSDIGYHYFLPFNGDIQIGRDLENKPAAQAGHNRGTIAICLHGLLKTDFTYNQFDALQGFCKQINNAYSGKISFHGHCEVSEKPCPVFDYKEVLNLSDSGYLKINNKMPTLDLFDTGIDVITLQKQLNIFLEKYNSHINVDGIFGQATAQIVIFFQMENGLKPDGIVGPKTRLALPPIIE